MRVCHEKEEEATATAAFKLNVNSQKKIYNYMARDNTLFEKCIFRARGLYDIITTSVVVVS